MVKEKVRLCMICFSPVPLRISTTHIILSLSLLVPLATTISIDLPIFDSKTKLTCSPNHKGICLQGDAFLNQGVQLTKNQLHTSLSSSVGRAVYSQPVHIWDSATRQMTDFTTQFSFIIHDVDPLSPSGDGLAFFLSSYPSVIPDSSAGGFLGLFPNSSHGDRNGKMVAIEFDTYPNSELDSSSTDHIGINVNSIRSIRDLTVEGGIKKRTLAKVRVGYNAKSQTLSVALTYDDSSSESNYSLSHVMDLREVLPEYVSIGFSAATGSFVETHTIYSWSFDSNLDTGGSGTARLLVLSGTLIVVIVSVLLLECSWRKNVARRRVQHAIKDAVAPSEKMGKRKGEHDNVDSEDIKETRAKEKEAGVDSMFRTKSGRGLMEYEDVNLDGISLEEGGGQDRVISSESEPFTGQQQGKEDVSWDSISVEEGGGSQNQVNSSDSETSTRQQGQKDGNVSLAGIAVKEVGGRQNEVISSYSETLTRQEGGQKDKDISLAVESLDEDEHGIIETEKMSRIVEGGTNLDDVSIETSIVQEGGGSHMEAPIPMDFLDRWSPKEIPYHVLMNATNNFSEEMMLGKGGFGPVYRGYLSYLGLDAAIKRLSERSQQGMSEYMAEVNIITQLRHRNLVKLIGWCHEHGELMLVYEFMPNGSLDNHLFRENNLLGWSVRYKIVLGLANAIMYLHDECEPYVLHRDIKSGNVLLDSKFDSKLADFGLAKLFNLDMSSLRVTHAAGTRGYWAPEYALMSKASRKSDVYSYGVVALEIACGRKAILTTTQGGEEDVENSRTLLVEWVWDLYGKGDILDAADKRLNGQFDHLQMEQLLITGLWCAHPNHRQRPSIRQASNALLYPETTPLPTLTDKMPHWAFPLGSMQMQVAKVQPSSPMLLVSPTSTSFTSHGSTSSASQHERHGDTDLNILQESTTMLRKPKHQFFARLIGWLKKKKLIKIDETQVNELVEATNNFSLSILRAATGNFSDLNLLGQGGFGPLYKGLLPDGKEIAVKRLLAGSRQGVEEMKNEVVLLAKLQHGNLVRLQGICLEGEEKLLVYEYVPNESLDKVLFDPAISQQLNWEKRYRIIGGISRGLQYLHEDSQVKIVHRDLKASNVLLDADMNSKISNFGLARLFGGDQTQAITSRVVGTFGYMAPEYAMKGHFSNKSDVFSFGVLVLEIVTGQRNNTFSYSATSTDLLTYVWQHWTNGTVLEIIDPSLGGQYQRSEVMRCIQIGLLCVQEAPADRPTMSSVVLMLRSYSVSLQLPSRPAFVAGYRKSNVHVFTDSSTATTHEQSVLYSPNELSITDVEPR